MAKFKHVSWTEYGQLMKELTKEIRAEGQKFDLVIGVARGGIPGALYIADNLNVKVDIINIKSYTGIAERGEPRIISTAIEEVKGKSVLVVDDLVDEGTTMEKLEKHLRKENPKELTTAVIFTKPWSRFTPDFYVKITEKWIVFPWEKGEIARALRDNSIRRR